MIPVGLVLCAISEALWDFLTAFAFAGYRLDAALDLGEREMTGNLHVAVLLMVLLGAAALLVHLLQKRDSRKSAMPLQSSEPSGLHGLGAPLTRR